MKTIQSFTKFILTGLLFLIISSCENESLPDTMTEVNLKQSWVLQKYFRNGTDETSLIYIKNYEETYSGTDTYSRTYTNKNNQPVSESGTWKFNKDEKTVNISGVSSIDLSSITGTVSSSYYKIVKLNANEFWYNYINGNNTHEFHFIKK